MKASESNSRYTPKVRECTNYAVRGIKNLFKTDPPVRRIGSEGEIKVRDFLKNELSGFCDSAEAEPFKALPSAKKLSYLLFCIFTVIAVVAYTVVFFVTDVSAGAYPLSKIMAIAALSLSVLGFLSLKGLYVSFSKVAESANIFAVRNPKSETRHQIIFCANTDAPFEDKFTVKASKIINGISVFGLTYIIVCDLLILFKLFTGLDILDDSILKILGYVQFVFIPFFALAVFANSGKPVETAVADNLSGCFACVGAMRYLSVCDIRLEHTAVAVLLTSAKNASSAGAVSYLKKHGKSDKEKDTVIICLDTLKGVESIAAKSYGSQKADDLLNKASSNAYLNISESGARYLKSDAGVFAKNGMPSAAVTSLAGEAPDFYHSNTDNIDNLDTKATEAAIKLLLECAFFIDAN